MTFALYRRPGGVVFLDDDPDYLEMLAEVMPPDWHVQLFLRPVGCIDTLMQEPPCGKRTHGASRKSSTAGARAPHCFHKSCSTGVRTARHALPSPGYAWWTIPCRP
ncbi:hypothetical protein LP415_24030 [Polaromonas sp. P1(28)-8]|nr:hypothetical protein LP415_24030 [Polaromonas sp. P1(28)-8]